MPAVAMDVQPVVEMARHNDQNRLDGLAAEYRQLSVEAQPVDRLLAKIERAQAGQTVSLRGKSREEVDRLFDSLGV